MYGFALNILFTPSLSFITNGFSNCLFFVISKLKFSTLKSGSSKKVSISELRFSLIGYTLLSSPFLILDILVFSGLEIFSLNDLSSSLYIVENPDSDINISSVPGNFLTFNLDPSTKLLGVPITKYCCPLSSTIVSPYPNSMPSKLYLTSSPINLFSILKALSADCILACASI